MASEDVPLRTHIPYHEHVIWCRYEDIPDVVAETLRNYDRLFEKIHGPAGGLAELLASMLVEFERSMDRVIAADGLNSDIHASAEYRAHLVSVMARRAVDAANK